MISPKIIYVLRHGQTDLNKQGIVQGREVNTSLNELGSTQARKACESLSSSGIQRIYTSELMRTHETVADFNLPKKSLPGFDEISWGELEGKVPTTESKNEYARMLRKWQEGELNVSLPGGESPLQVMNRQKDAMEVVLADESESVLICMHGRAMRILICWLLGYNLRWMDNFEHTNCCYYKLTYTGQFRLDQYCVTEHLN